MGDRSVDWPEERRMRAWVSRFRLGKLGDRLGQVEELDPRLSWGGPENDRGRGGLPLFALAVMLLADAGAAETRLVPGMPANLSAGLASRLAPADARHADLGPHAPWSSVHLVVGRREGETSWAVLAIGDAGTTFTLLAPEPGASADLKIPGSLPVRRTRLTILGVEPDVRFTWVDEPVITPREFARRLSEVKVRNLGGTATSFGELAAPITVVAWWATWCKPCVEEIPELNSLADEFQSQHSVRFLALSPEEPERLRNFLERMPFRYTQHISPEAQPLLGPAFPRNLVIVDGELVYDSEHQGEALVAEIREVVGKGLSSLSPPPSSAPAARLGS